MKKLYGVMTVWYGKNPPFWNPKYATAPMYDPYSCRAL